MHNLPHTHRSLGLHHAVMFWIRQRPTIDSRLSGVLGSTSSTHTHTHTHTRTHVQRPMWFSRRSGCSLSPTHTHTLLSSRLGCSVSHTHTPCFPAGYGVARDTRDHTHTHTHTHKNAYMYASAASKWHSLSYHRD